MQNTRIGSFKFSTLLLATSLVCGAGLGTSALANQPAGPGPAPLRGPGNACVVIRHSGAKVPGLPINFGHIGWAVEIGQDHYMFGAVEGKSKDGSKGWSREGRLQDMWAAFEHPGHTGTAYDSLKCTAVARPNLAAAVEAGRLMPFRSKLYDLLSMNCLHATYSVIHAYGATSIPSPSGFDRAPNRYYDDFKGQERLLHR